MLRRCIPALALRRTVTKRGGLIHPIDDPAKMPSADEATGIFYKPYNGPLKPLRLIDPRWILNRMELMKRDGLMGIFLWYLIFSNFLWFQPQKALWSDGAPPRRVDWNPRVAGALPKDFTPSPAY